jgi:hypothetical protein
LKRRNRCSPTTPAILRTVVAGDDLIRPSEVVPTHYKKARASNPVSRVLSSLETAALTHLFPHSIATWGRHNDYLHRVLRRAGKHANCGQLVEHIVFAEDRDCAESPKRQATRRSGREC